jgi:Fe2+ transport system protein FeoA
MKGPENLPLGCCRSGEVVRVESIGADTAFANRLRAMGIHDGVELDVVRTGSTMIVRLNHGSRLCLRGDDVDHIWVSPSDPISTDSTAWALADLAPESADTRH